MDTYEKKYKEALEKARQLCAYPTSKPFISDLQDLFPELKESEDERIRKAIIKYFAKGREYLSLIPYNKEQCVAWLEKQGEQKPQRMISAEAKEAMYDKPVWSEEDEQYLEDTLTLLEGNHSVHTYGEVKNWLKSLKDRVQPKQEWSEEDETVLNNLIYALANDRIGNNRDEYVDWLKSLKERYRWKPSEEQIKALHDLNLTGNISYAGQGQTLIELYNDLKKLTEE